jgi:hypothetical protein
MEWGTRTLSPKTHRNQLNNETVVSFERLPGPFVVSIAPPTETTETTETTVGNISLGMALRAMLGEPSNNPKLPDLHSSDTWLSPLRYVVQYNETTTATLKALLPEGKVLVVLKCSIKGWSLT